MRKPMLAREYYYKGKGPYAPGWDWTLQKHVHKWGKRQIQKMRRQKQKLEVLKDWQEYANALQKHEMSTWTVDKMSPIWEV